MDRKTAVKALVGLTLASAMASFALCQLWLLSAKDVFLPLVRQSCTLVIDPGHGGEDGGAVSLTGVPESRINLSIALKCDQIAGLYGVPALLLRQEEVSLADPSAQTLREKKRSDLKQRVAVTEATEGAVLLSIHQNKYDAPASRGAQVFYRQDPVSEAWAMETQRLLTTVLDPANHRAAKVIPKEIYLMSHITCPAILVECGFLSNPEEEALLRDEGYQTRVAVVLAGGFLPLAGGGK